MPLDTGWTHKLHRRMEDANTSLDREPKLSDETTFRYATFEEMSVPPISHPFRGKGSYEFPLLVRGQTSVLRHRVSPYDDEFTQIHILVKTSIPTSVKPLLHVGGKKEHFGAFCMTT